MARQQLTSDEAAYEAAVKMLTRKQRSVVEVQNALLDAGAEPSIVSSVLDRLKSHRHLDDAALAEDEAFKLVDGKGLSPSLAVLKLTERGLAESLARDSVQASAEGRSELELCRRALDRRLRGKRLSPTAELKEGRALARLGYEEDVVSRTLEQAIGGGGET